MKVLHFKTNYLNLSEIFINRLVHHHKKFEPVIATCYPRYYTENINLYAMPEAPLLSRWRNKLLLNLNKSPSFLYDVVRREKPDLIHGHFGLDSYRLTELKNHYNLPFIVNFYGYDVLRLPEEFGWKWRYKKLAREGDLYFVGSGDMKQNVIELGFPADKIRVLKLGMNIDQIEYVHRNSAGPRLMMVGRMVEKKGFEYAIKAVQRMGEQGFDIHLDLYGDGELRSELENLTNELQVKDRITFHGQTENEKVFQELYRHDILLVPSVQAADGDREGIPQTTVEGMATGIPVVASDHGGLPELVDNEETGLRVPARDAEAISNAVAKYLDQPSLVAKVSENGRKRVKREHNITTQVEKAERWYESIL